MEKIYQFFVLLLNYVIVVKMVCLDERKRWYVSCYTKIVGCNMRKYVYGRIIEIVSTSKVKLLASLPAIQ